MDDDCRCYYYIMIYIQTARCNVPGILCTIPSIPLGCPTKAAWSCARIILSCWTVGLSMNPGPRIISVGRNPFRALIKVTRAHHLLLDHLRWCRAAFNIWVSALRRFAWMIGGLFGCLHGLKTHDCELGPSPEIRSMTVSPKPGYYRLSSSVNVYGGIIRGEGDAI